MNETALQRAQRVGVEAAELGFDWEHAADALDKVAEEAEELREAVELGLAEGIDEELGDLLFSVVNVARKLGVNAEDALARTNEKFERRFAFVVEQLEGRGKRPEDSSLEEMEQLWEQAKQQS